ncbi:1,4-beta-xylanase [Synechococcus elongatus PCC 7943]|uniref:endo-1,4-beta-xylanase n=1 Tax=Synechococcus elongatus TaxID=32046 RepID=UPI00206DC167|nr:endo-1,4-beta-xylanase [Synechococcus elongatus]UOW71215.1 1,4-beta-xylanase [Synechococcus elongatus PCC 7943]
MIGHTLRRRQFLQGLCGASAVLLAQQVQAAPARLRSLAELAQQRSLLWGSAITTDMLAIPDLAALYRQQTSLLVPEWEMKWEVLQPSPDRFDFSRSDRLLAFAQSYQAQLRGHTLLWHQQLPQWLASLTAAETATALQRYITTVVGHYRGHLQSWDVINEPIAENGQGLRPNLWLRQLGPSYLEKSLRWARAVDPTVPLVINDFGLEPDSPLATRKRLQLLRLVQELRDRDTPLQAIGFQAHLVANPQAPPSFTGFAEFLADLSRFDLDFYITELDVNDQALPANNAERDREVAQTYQRFLSAVLPLPRLKLVTTWGLSDRFTWLNQFAPRANGLPQRPLPFDSVFQPTETYGNLITLLQSVSNGPNSSTSTQ